MKRILYGLAVAIFAIGLYVTLTGAAQLVADYKNFRQVHAWLAGPISTTPDGKAINRSAVLEALIRQALQAQQAAPKPAVAPASAAPAKGPEK